MTPNISEFSYGYAVTSEVVKLLGTSIAAAPQFPTLYAEGQAGGGYDVKIVGGLPLFLQFKLSHYMARTNCKEHDLMGGVYYRWHLHSLQRSDQHNLLLELESKGNFVAYAAPLFYECAELNSHYLNDAILDNSMAFSPSDIGELPDEENHYIVFNRRGLAYRCSDDPAQVSFTKLSRFLNGKINMPALKSLDNEGVVRLGEEIIEAVEGAKVRRLKTKSRLKEINTQELSRVIRARPTLETLSLISRTVLDSELLIVNPQWGKSC
ncbi:hypothetical protein [Pseudomonas sp. SBB6]|uniref:hypothetical protein n=1 Tax=Pseudomonas sp. SBB6 TaxID=2962032 RepID=UPI0020B8EABD|nr:hypothetical protein [Pseudomonas sp. SBB6]MCP3749276.1 hypothetical protein [Pseudomonas sp. SBB6]